MNYKEIMALDIEYVNHPSYSRIDPKKMAALPLPAGNEKHPKVPPGLPAYIAHLYTVPLLTPAQEIYLFRRMNYFYRAAAFLRSKSKAAVTISRYLAIAEAARDLILESNLRLVVSYAKVTDLEAMDDRISEGNLILFRAVAKFDYSKGFKFSTFAGYAIGNRFHGLYKKNRKFLDRCRTGNEIALSEAPAKASEIGENAIKAEQIRFANKLISHAQGREKAMLKAKYWEGKTLSEIGSEHGITKERARQIIYRALHDLKEVAHAMV
jgi:RNA polymerase primary sigma factor